MGFMHTDRPMAEQVLDSEFRPEDQQDYGRLRLLIALSGKTELEITAARRLMTNSSALAAFGQQVPGSLD